MELVARLANQRGELLLHEVVNVFRIRIVEKFGRRLAAAANFRERFDNLSKLFGGKHSSVGKRVRMRRLAASSNGSSLWS